MHLAFQLQSLLQKEYSMLNYRRMFAQSFNVVLRLQTQRGRCVWVCVSVCVLCVCVCVSFPISSVVCVYVCACVCVRVWQDGH